MKPDLDFSLLPVTCDSTKITPGTTFVACDGTKTNGVNFVPEALARGAKKIIAGEQYRATLAPLERQSSTVEFVYTADPRKALALEAAAAHGYPTKKLRFIGITGTKGKSSITHMVDHILRQTGYKTALVGGVANKILDTTVPSSLTTPNSDFLQAFFASCVDYKVDFVIMEVSSHALSQDRVYGIEFDAVGFTNLANDHLDFHHTMDEYLKAKAIIFSRLKQTGKAIINIDHPWGEQAQQAARTILKPEQILTLSQQADAASQLHILNNSINGLEISVDNLVLSNRYLFGSPYAYNIAMAALIAQSLGIEEDSIKQAVYTFTGTPGRMQLHTLKNGAKVFVDFAHSGPPVEAVLRMLRPLTDNLVVLFGCGGDRPKERRISMARAAAEFGDRIIITEDNPRTEDRLQILRDIEANIPSDAQHKTITIQDRRQAIAAAIALATTPTSIVAILGKGHEPYQIIGTTHHHFDDFEEVQKF